MMRVLPLLLFLAALPVAAQPFVIDQAVRGGGPNADTGESIALDADGSRYVVGTFEGTASFGDVAVTSAGDSDFFLVKYDEAGNAVWARRGGTDVFNDFGTAVAVAPDGSVYAAGYFTGIATWDGGDNPDIELTTFSDFDAFVAKYTASGDLEWVRQAGGVGQDTGRDLAVDADGNVYFVGGFEGTGTFGSVVLESAGSTDAFLVKYDPDGNVLWARRGGSDQGDLAYGVAVTDDGWAHVSGSFRGVALFGALPIQSAGSTDVFVVQYDADGEAVWVEGIGADGSEFTRGGGIGVGPDGSVYVQGSFSNTILVGTDVLVSQGFTDIFVAKLSADGDEVWGRRGGGDGTNFSAALAVDANGNVLTTGYTEGTGSFADEPITTQGRDGYFAVFDSAGDLVTVELLGGTGQDSGGGIAVNIDRFAVTGSFRDIASFGDFDLTSTGSSDVFVLGGPGEVAFPSVLFVDADATGANDGSSWTDAFTDLQDALALAAIIDVDSLAIWVAEGTYFPTDDNDRTVSFELQSGRPLYGGFDGTETALDQRDVENNETVLSGDIGETGEIDDNSYSVVKALDVEASILDGFTVSDGLGSGSPFGSEPEYQARGGGLQIIGGTLLVSRCTFRNNKVLGDSNGGEYFGRGGGLYVEDAELALDSVRFELNSAVYLGYGGGLYSEGTLLVLSHIEFVNNSASGFGGGLAVLSGTLSITSSIFASNTADGGPFPDSDILGDGAGAYIKGGVEGEIEGTAFEENTADRNGGGVYVSASRMRYRNLEVRRNVADVGGGIYHGQYGVVEFDEVVLTENEAHTCGGLAADGTIVEPSPTNSQFVRNRSEVGASALCSDGGSHIVNTRFEGNLSTGPVVDVGVQTFARFTNTQFVGNTTANGVLRCQVASVDFVNSSVVQNVNADEAEGEVGGLSSGFMCEVEAQNAILWDNERG